MFRLMTLILVLIFPLRSFGALLFEPVAGYSDGKLVLSDDIDMDGFSYGGRIGYGGHNFQIAYDFLQSSFDIDKTVENFKTTEHGLFLGLRFWHMRLFAEFIASAEGVIGDADFNNGDGPKFGVNFYLFRNLSIEASWRELDYDDVDGDISEDYGYKAYFLGLTFPFELFGKSRRK